MVSKLPKPLRKIWNMLQCVKDKIKVSQKVESIDLKKALTHTHAHARTHTHTHTINNININTTNTTTTTTTTTTNNNNNRFELNCVYVSMINFNPVLSILSKSLGWSADYMHL
jgi:hypothetical protein